MSVNFQEWHQRYDSFEFQVKEFNKKIRKSALSKDEVDEIYTIVKREVDRLSALSEAATKREEELNKRKWCCCLPNRAAIWTLTGVDVIAKVCETAGCALAMFEDDPAAKWAGFSAFIVAGTFDGIATICLTKLSLDSDEASKLAKLNKQGVEHAKIFKKFLKRLKEIKHLEAELLEQYKSHEKAPLSDHIVVNIGNARDLDIRISACLKDYENLPSSYRREDVYCRIISHLIQRLPPDDPLRIGLDELEPLAPQEDISDLAEKPLPVHYLPTSVKKKSSYSEEKWNGEQNPRLTVMEEVELIDDSRDAVFEYEQQIACYKNRVIHRFGLKHDISFFETPKGWKISPLEGVKKMVNISEEETTIEIMTTPKTKKKKESTTSKDQSSLDQIV